MKVDYKVESDFIHNGLRCVVLLTGMGHRCGYVGIDRNHPLFNVRYSDRAQYLAEKDITDEWGGMAITPETYLKAHGGITYSDSGSYPVKSDLWWFGFDCAHAGDAPDYKSLLESGLRDREYAESMVSLQRHFEYGVVRTQEYVEQECRSLADQLARLAQTAREKGR